MQYLRVFCFASLITFSVSFRPPEVSQELGCSPTLSLIFGTRKKPEFFFDPLQIANDDNFVRLREAEIKHGRIAMLAVLETVVVPFVRNSLLPSDFPGGVLPAIQEISLSDAIKVVVTCAFLELFIFVQRDPKAMPGDYGTGYFGIRDKGLNEKALISELENGRLAMMAIVIQVFNEVVTNESWDEQWLGVLKRWIRELIST